MKKKTFIEIKEEVTLVQEDHQILLEVGDRIRVFKEDSKEDYALLSRLQKDCEYVIKTAKNTKHLWADTVDKHIAKMKELFNRLKEKPDWITMKDIEGYEVELKKIEKSKKEQVLTIIKEISIVQKDKIITLEAGDKIQVIEGKNPYNDHNFWVVTSTPNGENVLEGFKLIKDAEVSLKKWLKTYPNAEVVDYDPAFN